MAKVTVIEAHALEQTEARARVKALGEKLQEKYPVEATWISDWEARIERTGVKAKLWVEKNAVRIDVELSFLLAPLRAKIEARLSKELKNCLTSTKST